VRLARPGLTGARTKPSAPFKLVAAIREEPPVIILGIILGIIGLFTGVTILWTIGMILLVIGSILALLGTADHTVGRRRHYY
jgi:Family of unknown function (DUF6131)